jgi:hypothetical protein
VAWLKESEVECGMNFRVRKKNNTYIGNPVYDGWVYKEIRRHPSKTVAKLRTVHP